MNKLILLLATVSAMAMAQPAHYQELSTAGGKINWTTGRISAEGYGLPPANAAGKAGPLLACRAAVVDAQRNLLEATQGVRVTATTVIDNYMLTNDEVKSSVEGVVKNARIIGRVPNVDGSCKVELEIPLAGKTSQVVYQEVYQTDTLSWWFAEPIKQLGLAIFPAAYAQEEVPLTAPPWAQAVEGLGKRLAVLEQQLVQNQAQTVNSGTIESAGPTGLVVDARGSHFIPSLSPKIRMLRGGVVYPDDSVVNGDKLNERGQLVSLFAKDVDFAIQHPTVGSRPLLVKALRTYGDTRTEIVLSEDYAQRVVELNKEGFFNDAGVIIVLD